MDKFIGTWKTDVNSFENFDEWKTTAGYDTDSLEYYRKNGSCETWKKDGDKWCCESDEGTYVFELGKEQQTNDGKHKFTINIDSDGAMIEKVTESEGQKAEFKRQVQGDVIFVTLTDAKWLKYKMIREK